MKKFPLLTLIAAFFALACLFYVATTRAQSAKEPARLFDAVGAERAIVEGGEPSKASSVAVREQEIRVNFGSVDFAEARELSLPLFGGKPYTAVRSEAEGFAATGDGSLVWRGKIYAGGDWSGDVTLSVAGRALSGLIYTPEGVYEIVPQKDFRHLLVQINQSRFAPCGGTLPERPASEVAALEAAAAKAQPPAVKRYSAADSATAAPDDGSFIDVLIVYTAEVRTALGGTTQAESFAAQSISISNTAYINSDINTRLRLAGTLEVGFAEAGTLGAALDWVDSDVTVAAARNSVKADMVAIIVERASDACGLAYVMHNVGPGFSGSAYSASARSCAVGNLTFPHELGHNEGCEHNPENGSSPSIAAFPYAYGHYVNGAFRTVMSYVDPCTQGCARVPNFSNPAVNVNGVPTGIADQRDNHRVINNTALTVSQFRDGSGGTGGPPANDNFVNALSVSGNSGNIFGSNVSATKEAGEPAHAGNAGGTSVWYRWQAPASGTLTLTTAGSSFDTLLAVYTGASVGALAPVASNDNAGGGTTTSSVVFNVTAGTTYRIAVDGSNGASGSVSLIWSNQLPAPPNDNFANAQVITGVGSTAMGSSVNATREAGEPNHGGISGSASSIWYRWQAPASGVLTVTTAGSSFDTTLGAYTGPFVSGLTTLAGNDDDPVLFTLSSRVVFNVTAGTTYHIAVDGFNNASGSVVLNWSLTSCTYTLTPGQTSFPAEGGTGSVSVTTSAGCPWTPLSNSTFITIFSPAQGSGSGTAIYSVGPNGTTSPRAGSLSIAGQVVNVTQAAAGTSATIDFNSSPPSVLESGRKVQINVFRSGNTTGTVSVDYATSDATADSRKDYTQTIGTLTFAPGETTKTITVFVTDDTLQEPIENFNVTLSNPVNAFLGLSVTPVFITSEDASNGPNPVDPSTFNASFFVAQHYVDFFGREADAPGLAFWTDQITSCGTDPVCGEGRRINVSGAFFLSIEFQNTGYLVERVYKASFGDRVEASTGLVVPIIRLNEFLGDTRRIGQDIIVGMGNWQPQLEANKQAFMLEFVRRPRFLNSYPLALAPSTFVSNLNINAGSVLTQAQFNALVAELTANNTDAGRASVLRQIAENAELDRREKNRAFVLMQYFGYLRRNPDDAPERDRNYAGWNFWLTKLNDNGGDFHAAQMVKAFLDSVEYHQRFGP